MVTGGLSTRDGIEYYRIDDVGGMEPFLMTVVSDSDLWMFVSSTGALTAGRIDSDHALLPYETDDRLHRAAGITGPVTVIARSVDGVREIWRPFGPDRNPLGTRSIAKSVLGDRLVFEEHHAAWRSTFRATWAPSDAHGWVRTVELVNHDAEDSAYEVLDGLLDVMPSGIDAQTEMTLSNLADAYKRSETGPWGSLAVFTLESLITDRAEPAEALAATVVWSAGFGDADIDLDHRAVADMLEARPRRPATLVTGRPGAYLLRGPVVVPGSGTVSWSLIADTGLDHAAVLDAARTATSPDATDRLTEDIGLASTRLTALLEGADAFQTTGDDVADAHHLSNVLFNSMRGGVFPFDHRVPVPDLAEFIGSRNRPVFAQHRIWLDSLGTSIEVADLRARAADAGDPDLIRLVLEYLPLTFSRRHGDPSRPWNRFSIDVRTETGDQVLSYEGNWRDIFQNWEALLHSYPAYFAHVVAKFVNASTIEGFNPYRISRAGVDWEVPDPHDPWSHIGYWGDHQIVYLMRLLEAWERYEPGAIGDWLDRPLFAYADVPYDIADHDDMVRDPRNTITYDEERAAEIGRRQERLGADGRLVVDGDGAILRVAFIEKLLVPALAKLSSFVPDGGIWLNTQRPEWNDANNALAGPGLSMVTLYHLRRYLDLVDALIGRASTPTTPMTASVAQWLEDLTAILDRHPSGERTIDDAERRVILDALGRSASAHRNRVGSGSGLHAVEMSSEDVRRLCALAREHLDRSIRLAQRDDGLYHSYNRVSFPTDATAQVDHLGPMLEGQVAILSAGTLTAAEAVALVDALFESSMYRPDQNTFMLYPATPLRPFLDRNLVPDEASAWIGPLLSSGGPLTKVFAVDHLGRLHFRPEAVNSAALEKLLDREAVGDVEREAILDLYEEVFEHRSFTGRSGSMYRYEGLGSVYWHMVAKLLLSVQETYRAAIDRGEPDDVVVELARAYRRIRSGLGFEKDPASYGAIPTDCYSHTPAGAGAQQPGMTGQVKEEVITRFGELGFWVAAGTARLAPGLLPPDEVFPTGDTDGFDPARFSVCGVPMTVRSGGADAVTVQRADGTDHTLSELALTPGLSQDLFARSGSITRIDWVVGDTTMKRWISSR